MRVLRNFWRSGNQGEGGFGLLAKRRGMAHARDQKA